MKNNDLIEIKLEGHFIRYAYWKDVKNLKFVKSKSKGTGCLVHGWEYVCRCEKKYIGNSACDTIFECKHGKYMKYCLGGRMIKL